MHCDIILRDESIAAEHVAITRDEAGVHVRALAAGFGYDDRVIAPGDSILIAPAIGETGVMLGSIHLLIRQQRSSTAAPVADARLEQPAKMASADSTMPAKESRPYKKALVLSLFGIGSALTAAAFALSIADTLHHKPSERLESVQRAATMPQLSGVKVEEVGGKITLSGFVKNEDEKSLLRSRIKPGTVDHMNVFVGTELAFRAKEVLRVNGHAAVTTYQPHGKVTVALTGVDKQNQDRLADLVRKDLPMIAAVEVTSTPTAADLARLAGPTCINPEADRDSLKFVAAFAADPAFVRTADGVKRYVGSRLPTGHEIREIRETEIILECVGKFTTISL
jgi:hypothetical protein